MLFVIIAQLIIINIIKVFWGRPRMRMIETTDGATFQPWYVIGSSMKEKLMALGIASEEFKSFPSGHSASATCIFLLLLLPKINIRFASKKNWLFWGSFLFAVLVAFSRIIMGAHFLTDVTIGCLVTIVIILIANKIFTFYDNL